MDKMISLMKKRGFWDTLRVLYFNATPTMELMEDGTFKRTGCPIYLKTFYRAINYYNLFYRVENKLLKLGFIEIYKENTLPKGKAIRLTEKGLDLAITLYLINRKYFEDGK